MHSYIVWISRKQIISSIANRCPKRKYSKLLYIFQTAWQFFKDSEKMSLTFWTSITGICHNLHSCIVPYIQTWKGKQYKAELKCLHKFPQNPVPAQQIATRVFFHYPVPKIYTVIDSLYDFSGKNFSISEHNDCCCLLP